jgi:hypothetical protein
MKKSITKTSFIAILAMLCAWNLNAQNHYIVLSLMPANGGTASGGGYNIPYGEMITVTATPFIGYNFINWTEEGVEVSTDVEYTFTVTGNRHLVANFETAFYEIYVYANPGEGGNVTGGGVYLYGDIVTLSAMPNPGYRFVNWTRFLNGNGTVVSTDLSYTFEVTGTGGYVYVAYFEPEAKDETLYIEPIDAGAMMIYPNPSNSDMKIVLNNSAQKIVEMELYDLTGKKVHQQTVNQSYGTLQLNGLSQSTYILKLFLDNGEIVTWRVVKN